MLYDGKQKTDLCLFANRLRWIEIARQLCLSHHRVFWPAATLGCCPTNVVERVFDFASFAMQAVGGVDVNGLIAFAVINLGWAKASTGRIVRGETLACTFELIRDL